MVVAIDFRVDVRPYSGYTDPSLPIAAWIAQGGVAGDASGGSVFMDFIFQDADNPQVTELYSLDQISFDTTGTAAREVALSTVNMDTLAPNRRASPQFWRFRTETIATVGISALDFENPMLPLWLGSPNKDEGKGAIRLNVVNVDLLLYAATLQGYVWGPRSVLAPGGPRRPIGGLFK